MTSHRVSIGVIAAILVACVLAACGGGSGTSSPTETKTTTASAEPDGSAEFPTSKGDAKFVKFGAEASAPERSAADAVLQSNFKARAAADFTTQCATLDRKTVEELVGPSQKPSTEACARELSKLAQPLSGTKKARADTLGEPIAALRVKGNRGWALFHGNDGKDYAILMNQEGGFWKVGALLASEL